MNPRKKESKKWSALPGELSNQIKTVFEQNFENFLNEKTIKVEGRIYPTEVLLRVGIHKQGELRHNNFEVSLDYVASEQNIVQKIHLAVDAIASLMLEYFESEEPDVPYTWRDITFENQTVYFQFSTENPDLEKEANKLLGIEDDTLLVEEEDDEVIKNEMEDLDLKKPSIFKSNKKKKDDLH